MRELLAVGELPAQSASFVQIEPPNQNQMDEQLVDEFVDRCLAMKTSGAARVRHLIIPWSQLDAVLRRFGVTF